MFSATRREFLRYLGTSAVPAVVPGFLTVFSSGQLSGCQWVQPQPFETGRQVPAPLGCTELRARNAEGDC